MNHANVAYNLLATDDPIEATDLAYQLNQNNQDRQKLTDELVREAIVQVEARQMDQPVLFVIGKSWSAGIVGLIASRIKERYQKPTIAMAENAAIIGSGRSVAGFNLIEALQELPEFFLKCGGHPMACGFTLRDAGARVAFEAALIAKFLAKTALLDMQAVLPIDAEITLEEVSWDLYDVLEKFKPFGQGNEKPKYLASGVTVVGLEPVGQTGKHLRLLVRHQTPKIKKTIGWNLCAPNSAGVNWGQELKVGQKIDMVFEIDVNEWNGNRELQLTIVDLRNQKI
jgi:single-stranded-DNA-specific exonuclease